jgi:hypothetical protein
VADAGFASASHARHDRFVIAEALGGGSLPVTVGMCPACGALHRDLLSIQVAIRHAWTPRRPRDLRLATADVSRLRPVLWRRVLGLVGSSRDAITRPLAIGLTSLGLAGLLAANVSVGAIGLMSASGGAASSVPPESATSVEQPTGGPTIDHELGERQKGPDALIVVSAASIAAGGGLAALRLIASRARPMR